MSVSDVDHTVIQIVQKQIAEQISMSLVTSSLLPSRKLKATVQNETLMISGLE
jgi:hypothetical protein